MAYAIPFLATWLLLAQLAVSQTDSSTECSCFLTNGSSSGYFNSHNFYDYRNVPDVSPTIPPVIGDLIDTTNAPETSDFFTSDEFQSQWEIQNWNNSNQFVSPSATVGLANSLNNVYIEASVDNSPDYSTYLTLRTSRLPDFQSVAELDSTAQDYHYVSMRILARVVGSPGACAGMFTYLPSLDTQKIQEADIEILTSGPRNMVQYTNQPSLNAAGDSVPEATANVSNPNGKDWTQWNTYRVDWMPGKTSWYVDGQGVAEIVFQTPRDPAGLIMNMWSDGGSWTGNMSVHDAAYLQIQWVELVFNSSNHKTTTARKRDGQEGLVMREETPGCKVVCSVDEHNNGTGMPAVLKNTASTTRKIWGGEGIRGFIWIPTLLASALVFGSL